MSLSHVPVTPGTQFNVTAQAWNQVMRAQEWHARTGQPIYDRRQFSYLICCNDTSTDLRQFAAVSIDGPVFTVDNDTVQLSEQYFAYEPVMKAHKPDWRKGTGFGICLDPIAENGCGRVLTAGVVAVKLIGNRQIMVCGPDLASGTTDTLQTGAGPCRIKWQAPGDDEAERWGLIQLGTAEDIEGTITEVSTPDDGLTGPTVCKLKPWRYVDGQSQDVAARQMEVIDYEITVMNRDASLEPEEDAYGIARWINNEWRLIWVSC